ncbi:uncharacterized protein M6B38_386520 [Iris pallida]|uniref:C2H2-type domain-containing protein n=1 Tax=Iris pallida TaxID=29817 RepID=A0AAX6G1P3_IRIPA|nr:uncharacterized protein M6B38_386520 [Iris pallida]
MNMKIVKVNPFLFISMFPMKKKGKKLSMADRCGSPLVLLHLLLTVFLMAFLSFLPTTTTPTTSHHNRTNKKKKKKKKEEEEESEKKGETCTNSTSSSWDQFKNLLSCKNNNSTSSQVHDPSSSSSKYVKLSSTCGASICSFRDHGNTRVVDHASNSSDGSNNAPQRSRRKAASAKDSTPPARPSHAKSGGSGGMQLKKLSGCYECRAIDAEPASRRYPRPRTLCPCNDCGEVFTKPESLEHHQALRHAVSEQGPEDSGRNIVEIIFKSSWQKKDSAVCRIERILKVHNTQRTAARFEDYREYVKSRAPLLPRKNPRCAADGNELLRFHCTSLSCPLGANSSTSLCLASSSSSSSSSSSTSAPNTNLLHCDVCTIIRHGFSRAPSAGPLGIRTTASSGRADDCGPGDRAGGGARRAMLMCRVIAGRVTREDEDQEGPGQFDSVAGEGAVGSYGNLEELFVANPRAILPCFVVIYRVMD